MTNKLTEKEVANYLVKNPDFFVNQEALLSKLKIKDNRDGTVSLVEKQMSLMRERQKRNREQLKQVIDAAKQNNAIFDKSRNLILGLLAAETSCSFFSALEKGLKRDFKCKSYALIVFGKPRKINHFVLRVTKDSASNYVGALMRSKRPTLGVLRPEEQNFLFGEQSHRVKSAAVLPVKQRNKYIGMLAIGSSDTHYFSPKMETLFIDFIADTLAKLLPRHVPR